MQFFANSDASFAFHSLFGVSTIFLHHASLPTFGEQAATTPINATKPSIRTAPDTIVLPALNKIVQILRPQPNSFETLSPL
jgi:hypothetical protein